MSHFLNFAWNFLFTENPTLINIILIPACFIESALLYNIIITILGINLEKEKNIFYTIFFSIISVIFSLLIPAPFDTIVFYVFVLLALKLLLHANLLKSFLALILSLFIIALINALIQKPYLLIFNIDNTEYMLTPIYRIGYLILFQSLLAIIYIIMNKLLKEKVIFSFFDMLDKKTIKILYFYMTISFIGLLLQLIITAFYIDTIPIFISIFNFGLLLCLFISSFYTFSRVISLETTKQNLQIAEEYNKSLTILYDEVKGFNHDFKNIVSTIDGYVENVDISGLKQYIGEVKEDCRITNNLSILNPRTINNPGIYSLLNNKYFKATNSGIKFELDFFLDLNTLQVNNYKFSRILGVLLDNAIEEAEKCDEKIIKVSFRREDKNHRAVILIQNTYTNKNVNIDEIFKKGFSGKPNHSGIGLWEVRKYVKNSKNLDLFTSKNNEFFNQELTIYDLNY